MSFAIKFSGVFLGKKQSGFVNPEKGEFFFEESPSWTTSDKTLALLQTSSFNAKTEGYRAFDSKYEVKHIFKVAAPCCAYLECSQAFIESDIK